MFTLLQILDVTEGVDTLHHCVETILVEDKSPIGSFNWSNAAIAFFGTLAGILALFPTWWTYAEQRKVAHNTQLLNADAQYGIMIDLVRHLYRNLVVMWAITNKMQASKYTTYPSEIHLTKAKIHLQDIHLELFAGDKDIYGSMNEMALLLRNYNLEIDVAMKHFAQKGLKSEVKKYDINTLLLKPGLLANQIVNNLIKIYPNKRNEIIADAKKAIKESHDKNVERNKNCQEWDKDFSNYNNPENHFLTQIFSEQDEFFTILNQDARIECGKNSENTVKILMIEL